MIGEEYQMEHFDESFEEEDYLLVDTIEDDEDEQKDEAPVLKEEKAECRTLGMKHLTQNTRNQK